MCPANSLIQALIRHITLERKDIVVMDMEAGLEHLGRATVRGFDAMICVVEPGAQSIETARKIKALASQIKVREVLGVGNKAFKDADRRFIEGSLAKIGLETIAILPFDENVLRADAKGIAPIDYSPSSPVIKALEKLKDTLKERY
jgi:CO dehydrogenase maturation factor